VPENKVKVYMYEERYMILYVTEDIP